MSEKTHFADDETLAHIARLEAENAELRQKVCTHGWRGGVPDNGQQIATRCPACGGQLFIGSGGHLTCSNVGSSFGEYNGCPEPSLRQWHQKATERAEKAEAELARAVDGLHQLEVETCHIRDVASKVEDVDRKNEELEAELRRYREAKLPELLYLENLLEITIFDAKSKLTTTVSVKFLEDMAGHIDELRTFAAAQTVRAESNERDAGLYRCLRTHYKFANDSMCEIWFSLDIKNSDPPEELDASITAMKEFDPENFMAKKCAAALREAGKK